MKLIEDPGPGMTDFKQMTAHLRHGGMDIGAREWVESRSGAVIRR